MLFDWLGWVKRDVHNGTPTKCVGCLILLGDMSAGRVGFILRRITIYDQGTEKSPITLDIGIHGAGNMVGVGTIRFGFIKLLVPWVV